MNGARSPAPRVALVHDWLTGMRGGEKVLEEMLRLFPDAEIFTLFHFPGTVSPLLESRPIHTTFLQGLPALRSRYRHYLPLFPRAIESIDLHGFDLVLSTSHCVAKGVRAPEGIPHVCYCHTPMRYVWDQQKVYFPPSRSPVALVRDALLARLRRWDRRTADRPSRYLANSSFVRDRIHRYYERDAAVLAPPVDIEFFQPDPELEQRTHLLCVAALNPYKKVGEAIEAAARLDLPLAVVGTGPDQDHLRRRIEALGAQDRIVLHGRVSADELRRLYQRAIAFVQPGIEDFGIAAVESLASGTPVVAAAFGGVLDIVQDLSDGVLFDREGGVDALVDAIERVADLDFDPVQAAQRAQRFATPNFRSRLEAEIESIIDS